MLRLAKPFVCSILILSAAADAGADGRGASSDTLTDSPANAETSPSYSWGLGLAAMSKQQAYAGIDRDNKVVPLIYFENDWVQLMGPRLEIKLPGVEWGDDQALAFGVGIEFDGSGYKPGDARTLNGMRERKNGFLSGAYMKWSNPLVDVSAEWMIDASNKSEGQRVSVGFERSFNIGERIRLTPGIGFVWLDGSYADYYYGVRNTEARADRPAYEVDSTINAKISVRTDYMVDEHQSAFLSLEHMALGSEIKDSPLTDRSGESMVFLGYLYRF